MHYVKAKQILSAKNGMNIYRGCSHGCIYCDSRSNCYGFTHKFEDIEVKENALELLEHALKSKRKKCMIGTGAMCDPYMHIEEKLCFTRQCLEIIDKYEFGVAIQTKSDRILRDGDREYFYQALDKYFPGMKQKYINYYGNAYELSSPESKSLMEIFRNTCKENGIMHNVDECFRYLSDLPERYVQQSLFDFV